MDSERFHDGLMADTVGDRLKKARIAAGYLDASQAARSMRVPVPTYLSHENGSRGLGRALARYSAFYRVSFEWPANGRGHMKPGHKPPVLELFEQLDADIQDQVIDYIRYLLNKSPKIT